MLVSYIAGMDDGTQNKNSPEGKRVLLVDDDNFLLDMYSVKFTGAGFTVRACLSVQAALTTLRGGFQPDAIVFDLTMPEYDGFSFLETLRSEGLAPNAIKIALTNQGSDEEKIKTEALGAHRYIVKASMIPSEVVTAVGAELAKK